MALGNPSGLFDSALSTYIDATSISIGETIEVDFNYDGVSLVIDVNGSTHSVPYTGNLYTPVKRLMVATRDDFISYGNMAIWDLSIGTTSTVRGSWDNITWADNVGTRHGTVYGGTIITV
jgi:hypothetical protein